VRASDNYFPTSRTTDASVTIFVTRDQALPVYTSNARYVVQIREDAPVGLNSIQTVSASRQGLIVSIEEIMLIA